MQGGLEGIMNALHGTVLCLALAMGGWACSAQETTIPFGKIEQNAQQYPYLIASNGSAPEGFSSSVSLADPSASSYVRPFPVTNRGTLGAKYFMLNGLHLGMAAFDVEMTHRCVVAHTCREGNPLMPSSEAGQFGVDLAYVASGAFASYKLKKHRSSIWWLAPTVGASAHGAGVVTGFEH
jgi:hypothetical protein